jgi:hypothetical protein
MFWVSTKKKVAPVWPLGSWMDRFLNSAFILNFGKNVEGELVAKKRFQKF